MSDNMLDLSDWREVTCEESEVVRDGGVTPLSSLTDIDGTYGRPVIYTEWARPDGEEPILRDYLYEPHTDDPKCHHFVPVSSRVPPSSEL